MSKIIRILSGIFLIVFSLLIYSPQTVTAQTPSTGLCTFTLNPLKPDQNMDTLKVKITSAYLTQKYRILLQWPNGSADSKYNTTSLQFDPEINLEYSKPSNWFTGWRTGTYTLYVVEVKSGQELKDAKCKYEFPIEETPQQACQASIYANAYPTRKPIEPGTNVILHVEGLKEDNIGWPDLGKGGYDIYVRDVFNKVYSTDNGKDINLGSSFDVGTYLVEVKERCGFVGTGCSGPPRNQCNRIGFKVAPKASGGGGEIPPGEVSLRATCKNLGDPLIIPGDAICTTSKALDSGCTDNAISTAIGCVHTDPAGFTKDFLTFIIGIAGGLAFLMMLLGAFQMLTSAGNPETLSAGRDRLQSAVIGLLFIIFAVLLLQIIGAGILNIPGFGS